MVNQDIYSYNGEPAGFEKVYVLICDGVPVVKRQSDGWMNATQILGVAGWSGLERQKKMQKLRNSEFDEHQTLKGAGIERGTWVPLEAAIRVAKEFFVYDSLKPILEFQPVDQEPPEAPPEILRLLRSGKPRQTMTPSDHQSSKSPSVTVKSHSSRSPSPTHSSSLSTPPSSPSTPHTRRRASAGAHRYRVGPVSTAIVRSYPARNAREPRPRKPKTTDGSTPERQNPPHKRPRHSASSEPAEPPKPRTIKPRNGLTEFSKSRGYNL